MAKSNILAFINGDVENVGSVFLLFSSLEKAQFTLYIGLLVFNTIVITLFVVLYSELILGSGPNLA